MRPALILSALLALLAPGPLAAQQPDVVEPFKVGTFEINGVPTVALVLRDAIVVDIAAANTALQIHPDYVTIPPPEDMLDLIERYDYGLRERLYQIVNHLSATNQITGANRAPYVHDLARTHTLPPIMYPTKILNAAVNFYSHVNEAGNEEEQAAARRERERNRGVPYLFLKPTRGALVADGDSVVIPYGRDRIDWEVELGTVIGKVAKDVSATDAQDYVFGYTVSVDMSDRGGRPPHGFQGVDWLVGKGHDTFMPMGPWIVPKEFFGNPMEDFRQSLTIDGTVVQEARAGDMIHSLWEVIEYGSSIITLYPGDVINNGTSGGTAAGAFDMGTRTGYLQPGERFQATIDGIGTLDLHAVAEEKPTDGTGSRLPPVSSYRND